MMLFLFAAALNYGVFRRNDINATATYIMFYDMGATSTVATIVGMYPQDFHYNPFNVYYLYVICILYMHIGNFGILHLHTYSYNVKKVVEMVIDNR